MPTEAQKRATQKWQNENMTVIGCKLKNDVAERFRRYCAEHGKAPNAVLREYIYQCIEGIPEPEETEKAGGI